MNLPARMLHSAARLVWASVGVFVGAIAVLWMLVELFNPTGSSAQASTEPLAAAAMVAPSASDSKAEIYVGRHVGVDGKIAPEMRADWFLAGEVVHAAMTIPDQGSVSVQAVWWGPKGTILELQTKEISAGQARIAFTLPAARTAKRGKYRIEIHDESGKLVERTFAVQ